LAFLNEEILDAQRDLLLRGIRTGIVRASRVIPVKRKDPWFQLFYFVSFALQGAEELTDAFGGRPEATQACKWPSLPA
jgi:hypothetical protein